MLIPSGCPRSTVGTFQTTFIVTQNPPSCKRGRRKTGRLRGFREKSRGKATKREAKTAGAESGGQETDTGDSRLRASGTDGDPPARRVRSWGVAAGTHRGADGEAEKYTAQGKTDECRPAEIFREHRVQNQTGGVGKRKPPRRAAWGFEIEAAEITSQCPRRCSGWYRSQDKTRRKSIRPPLKLPPTVLWYR